MSPPPTSRSRPSALAGESDVDRAVAAARAGLDGASQASAAGAELEDGLLLGVVVDAVLDLLERPAITGFDAHVAGASRRANAKVILAQQVSGT